MIHKNRKTTRFLAFFLAGIMAAASCGLEVLAAEPDNQAKLEKSLEEESDKAPETPVNFRDDLENTFETYENPRDDLENTSETGETTNESTNEPMNEDSENTSETGETANELPGETTDAYHAGNQEEEPSNSEEAPGNQEEEPSNSEEESSELEEESSNPEEESAPELTETVNGASGSYKNITWNIDDKGKLTIIGSGEFSDNQYSKDRAPWYPHRESITSAVIQVTGMTNARSMFEGCKNLESIDLKGLDTANITNMSYMFFGCRKLNSLDLSKFDTSKVTNMASMFYSCFNLTRLDLSKFNAGNVTNMETMLDGCDSLDTIETPYNVKCSVSLPVWEFGDEAWYKPDGTKITELPRNESRSMTIAKNRIPSLETDKKIKEAVEKIQLLMKKSDNIASGRYFSVYWVIERTGKLTVTGTGEFASPLGEGEVFRGLPWFEERYQIKTAEINLWGTKDASDMFVHCVYLTSVDLRNFDTSNVTDMSGMFYDCGSLTNIDFSKFDTSKVTDMNHMFSDCVSLTNINLSNFDTSNVTDMSGMFSAVSPDSKLTSLDLRKFNTSKVTSMRAMFDGRMALESIDLSSFDTSNVTDMSVMFQHCFKLKSVDVSRFNTANVTDMSYMFTECSKLDGLDVSRFNTSKVVNMGQMFAGCSSLTSLDVSHFDTSNVTNMGNGEFPQNDAEDSNGGGMFYGCTALTKLDVSHFDTSKVTDMRDMFAGCSSLTSLDVSNFDTSKATNMSGMFWSCDKLTSLDVSNFDTSKVTNMRNMFLGCSSLTSLDVSKFVTSKVTSMRSMFSECSSLTSLDVTHFDTSRVTSMRQMFGFCSSLTSLNISNFDTSKVTSMVFMFAGCSSLKSLDVTHFDTSNVIDMSIMFYNCSSLTSLDVRSFNTSKAEGMAAMFAKCSGLTKLDVSHFDTSKATSMTVEFEQDRVGMFSGCEKLESLDISNFDTSNVVEMYRMFSGCKSLKSLNLGNLNTSKVTTMAEMFNGCSKLTSLNVSSFDTSNVTDMYGMFASCSKLSSLDLKNFNTSKVKNMAEMFRNCEELTKLNLSSFRTSQVTDMYGMFSNCSRLTDLDLSSFNTSNVTRISSMFSDCLVLRSLNLSNFNLQNIKDAFDAHWMLDACGELSEIRTPLNLSVDVDLPSSALKPGSWYQEDGAKVTKLPKNQSGSIVLKNRRNAPVMSAPSFTARKDKTVYACGEYLNIDDITATYKDYMGISTNVTDFTTNADEISMSVPGNKILQVTYKGRTVEIALKVTYTLADSQVTLTFAEQRFVYSRIPITPEPAVAVRIGGTDIPLYEGRDYSLSYKNNVNAGNDAQIIITGQSVYSGTITRTFSIAKAPLTITASDIALIAGDKLPDASAYGYKAQGLCRGDKLIQKPSFTCGVADMDKTGDYPITPHDADAGGNYEITYESGTLTVVDSGVYHTVTFDMSGHGSNMTRRAIKAGSLLKEPAQPQDLESESAGYIFAGWYKDKSFAAKQKWDFALDTVQDDITLYACWLGMAAENGKGAGLCIQEILPQSYTGSPLKPVVLVYDGDGASVLKAGKDYTISYYNNTEADDVKFAGLQIPKGGIGTLLPDGSIDTSTGFNEKLAYAEIKGRGNYKGTVYRNFHIEKALISDDGVTLKYAESLACNDKNDQKPFASIKYKKAMAAGQDYMVTLSADPKEAYAAKADDGTGIPLSKRWQQSNEGKTLPAIPKGYFGTFQMTIEGIGNYGGTVKKTIFVSADKGHLIKNASVALGKNQKKINASGEELEQGIVLTPAYYDAADKKYYLFDENGEPTGTPMDKADDVFVVKAGQTCLKYRKDYEISYVNNHEIGTAAMAIRGIGEYAGTKNISFAIIGTPFKNIAVEGLTDMPFTGKALTQSALILTNGREKTDAEYRELQYGDDYSISYKNNIKKGTAAITFTAKPESGYQGSFKKTFKITAADLGKDVIPAAINAGDELSRGQDAYTFSGKAYYSKSGAALSGRIRLMSSEYADIILKEGADYTVNYANNKAVTEGADAIMTIKGKGNYQGIMTIKFPIARAPISAENKNLAITADAVYYDGQKDEYVPKIKVTDGKKALSIGENKDYIVEEYRNNDKDAMEEYLNLLRNGSAIPLSKKPQAVLSGKGNYNGRTTLYFDVYGVKINNDNIYIAISDDPGRLTYSGGQLKPKAAVYYSKDIEKVKAAKLEKEQDDSVLTGSDNGGYGLIRLANGMDYTLTWGSNVSAGANKGSVTVTGIGLYGGKATGKFTISSKDVYALE